MLGNTLTLPLPTGDIVLTKIAEQNYSSEYMFRNSSVKVNAKIRHSLTKATPSRREYERHNFEVVFSYFATDTVPAYERKMYFVIEHIASDTSVAIAHGVGNLMVASSAAFIGSLMAWES